MNTHSCLKCKTEYQDTDVEAYLCETCLVDKKRIAAEIDAKFADRPKKVVKSAIQEYDEAEKVRGFMHIRLS